MEIIIVFENGIASKGSPFLFKSEREAEAKYENLCRDLLAEDFDEIYRLGDDFVYDRVNNYLKYAGVEIAFYTGIPIF